MAQADEVEVETHSKGSRPKLWKLVALMGVRESESLRAAGKVAGSPLRRSLTRLSPTALTMGQQP